MEHDFPDLDTFERKVFKSKDALACLISFSRKLLSPRQMGLLYGTNKKCVTYLPPEQWDRGVMHKFDGRGFSGLLLKMFGPMMVRLKGLSPIRLYKETPLGDKVETDGIISFILRNHRHFYDQGISILIIDDMTVEGAKNGRLFSQVSITSYDGKQFKRISNLKMNNAIVRQFKVVNFLSAYIPDYGVIAFNTIGMDLLKKENDQFVYETELRQRLDVLKSAIETASLAHIGRARGRRAVQLIRHKEKTLRKTALALKQKSIELENQRKYLRAVGAVNEQQLNMEAVSIPDGVYAFMDMVGSAVIRKQFIPREYFSVLNQCHQIAADNAGKFYCRVDNFMGDGIFLENVSPFDLKRENRIPDLNERLMLMIFALASTICEIHGLKTGIDGLDINFRAGVEVGSAMVGPIGSHVRKIVTAIGKPVNNASRFESSGVKGKIHVSEKVIKILENAFITKDSRLLWPVLCNSNIFDENQEPKGISFFEAYRHYFKLDDPVIEKRNDVSYKEFSTDTSYLITCISADGKLR